MSRAGFPIDSQQISTVHSVYERWDGVSFPGTDSCLLRKEYQDKQGSNTPGWPQNKRTNSYLRSKFTWKQSPLNVSATVDNGGGRIDRSFGDFGDSYGAGYYPWSNGPFGMDDVMANVRSRLIGRIMDNIQSNRVNLGEIYHTRAQAASMVASTANRLAGAMLALRKGNFAGAARQLTGSAPRRGISRTKAAVGGIPEQWLALQYGWKPAVQDVYNSLQTVHEAQNRVGNELFSSTASASEQGDQISYVRGRVVDWGPQYLIKTSQRTVSGKASVTYGVDSQLENSLSQLGITNPASLAWELLPYSFVVDWFLPVGSYLERQHYDYGLTLRHGYISMHVRQRVEQKLVDSTRKSGNISATFSGANGEGEAFLMTREALTSFPSPPPPSLKNPFSLTHVANGLSLLATAFKGIK